MLSIQPVNLVKQQPAFKCKGCDDIYPEKQYNKDKSKLEENLDEVQAIVENVNVPKPIRALGKIASVGIGAGVGFVSMKYGAQGVLRISKKGYGWLKGLVEKPFVKGVFSKTTKAYDIVKESSVKFRNLLTTSKAYQKSAKYVAGMSEKFTATKVGQKLGSAKTNLVKSKDLFLDTEFAKYISKKYANIKNLTPSQLERIAVNFFGVSGGVTGGIGALEAATSDK